MASEVFLLQELGAFMVISMRGFLGGRDKIDFSLLTAIRALDTLSSRSDKANRALGRESLDPICHTISLSIRNSHSGSSSILNLRILLVSIDVVVDEPS